MEGEECNGASLPQRRPFRFEVVVFVFFVATESFNEEGKPRGRNGRKEAGGEHRRDFPACFLFPLSTRHFPQTKSVNIDVVFNIII